MGGHGFGLRSGTHGGFSSLYCTAPETCLFALCRCSVAPDTEYIPCILPPPLLRVAHWQAFLCTTAESTCALPLLLSLFSEHGPPSPPLPPSSQNMAGIVKSLEKNMEANNLEKLVEGLG